MARRSASKQPEPAANEFVTFALEEAEDNRILRSSLWVAVIFHALLLMINFPAFEGETRAAPEPDQPFRVYPIKRYERPEVPKTKLPQNQVRLMAMPDETPHDPEPIRLEERREIEIPEVDTEYLDFPEAPPPPEPAGPIPVGGEVVRPVKIHAPQPAYTEIARKARIQGTVIVQAIIDKNGDVTDVKVLKGLAMGLTEAAVGAIEQWKFKPATLRGKPVAVYYNLTVTFHLQCAALNSRGFGRATGVWFGPVSV